MADTFDSGTVIWVLRKFYLKNLLDAIDTCEEVVIDLETTGLDEHATGKQPEWPCPARIVLGSLTLPHENDDVKHPPSTWVVPLSHPDSPWQGKWRQVMALIAQVIRQNEKPIINQNMKFDSRWVYAHTGIDLSHQIVWDTQSGSHLLDENESTKLKVRAPKVFEVERWDDFDLSTPGAAERVPVFDLGLYAARDTYWTWRLAELQRQMMLLHPVTRGREPEGADEVEMARLGKLATWCAMPMVSTLTAIEQRGMRLDVRWVKEQLAEHENSAASLSREMASRAPAELADGEPSFAPTSKWFLAWAEAMVEAGELSVTSWTPAGRPQWSKSVLLRQARSGSQVAQDLLDYRGHAKKAEYLSSWLRVVTSDEFIHTTYHAARVVTGRLSSEGPNMQQVTAALKPAFIPSRPGFVVIDLDYSQIELRGAAFVSRCEEMLEAFRQGRDLHVMLAGRILQMGEDVEARRLQRPSKIIRLEDVSSAARQAGKSANFGLLYLISPEGFREYAETTYGISFTSEEAVLIHQAFFDQWPGIRQWHIRAVARAKASGQVTSPLGRVRRLPNIQDGNPKLRGRAERQAVNAPVQGFASDLMQIAAASIEGTLPGYDAVPGARLLGTVHDSVMVEASEDSWEVVAKACIDRMINIDAVLKRMDCHLDVPLAVEAKAGTRWGLSDVGTIKG